MSEFQLHPQLEQDSFFVADLPLCQLRLINDQQYPWFILVPRQVDCSEIYKLSDDQQAQLLKESSRLSHILMSLFKGDKLNVAAIGNMVPQLHVHHVVRFKKDVSWPKPVWGQMPMQVYSSDQVSKVITQMQDAYACHRKVK